MLTLFENGKPIRNLESGVFVVAAIMLTTFGPSGFNFLPLMMGAAAAQFGLDPATAEGAGALESIAAVELLVSGVSSIILSLFLLRRVNWRHMLYFSFATLLVGNLLSMTATSAEAFMSYRAIAGIGQGMAYALGLASVSVSARPARNFGLVVSAACLWQVIGFILIPTLTAGDFKPMMQIIALTTVPVLIASIWVPDNGRLERDAQLVHSRGNITFRDFALPAILVLVGFMIFNVSLGIIYPYMEIIAGELGATTDDFGLAVVAGFLVAAALGFMAGWIDRTFNDVLLIVVFGGINAVLLWLLAGAATASTYLILIGLYTAAWNFYYARAFTATSNTDRSGYAASFGPEAVTSGLIIGPILAQALTVTGDFSGQIEIAAVAALVGSLVIAFAIRLGHRKARQLFDAEAPA
ncbi:hypothetical protein J7426_24385 [Tropicibacter sp. R16_0]|uniref:MFS transporter n=1 Tax=Tropicibacter sp. R16_0 TaxID=2821102 RepID=UPI001ADD5335|nr:MFS transporter [Tropicibacter sp. R16_0]MBO9453420.1 hypothetical protein [Tropicibacter sp. R16_0]